MTLQRRKRLVTDELQLGEQYCACGCGKAAGFYRKTAFRGKPRTFIHGHHARKQGPPWLPSDCGFDTPCWIWQLARDQDGYALTTIENRTRRAARIYYEDHVGPIPEGLVIDHLCRVRACVNPEHLEPVTNAENLKRGEGFGAQNARKTHCPRGHPYDEANTGISAGRRRCRACGREQWHARKPAT